MGKREGTSFWDRAGLFARKRWLSADPRWLGVFRVLLGTLLSIDLLRRWADARAFYTNDGLLTNHFSLFRPMGRDVFSIFHAFSTLGEVSVAFAITLFVYLCFTVGWHARLFHVLSAICVTSLNARNIFVENGGTVVVNVLTVVTVFLPLGRRFSVDAVRASLRRRYEQTAADLNAREAADAQPVVSLAVLLVLVQWSAIYFFNTVHKDGAGWKDGTAIHWFLQQDRIATAFAIWLRDFIPLWLVKTLSWGTLVIEGAIAVLYLWPFWQVWTRRVILVLVWVLHGTIAAWARIGPFSYVMSLVPILLLGAADWQLVSRWFGRASRARRVVFDGSSGIHLLLCRVLVRLDPFERLTFIDARDTEALPAGMQSTALEAGFAVANPRTGRVLAGARGLAEALSALPLGFLVAAPLRMPGFAWLARRAVALASARRRQWSAWLGVDRQKVAAQAADTRLTHELRNWSAGMRELAVFVLGAAIVTQMFIDNRFLSARVQVRRPNWVATIIDYPRIYQGWSMFAPEPPYEDGRLVVDGRTVDGRHLDPLTGVAPDFDTSTTTGWGHDQLWCDYHNRIRFSGNAAYRHHLRNYLSNKHRFGGRPEDRLVAFDVWWVEERSPGPGERRGRPLPPHKLLSHGIVSDPAAPQRLAHAANAR